MSKDYIPAHLVVGSMPPSGYIAWHEWAEAQGKGGLKQSQCGECGLWFFPQEAINHAPNKACSRLVVGSGKKAKSTPKRKPVKSNRQRPDTSG